MESHRFVTMASSRPRRPGSDANRTAAASAQTGTSRTVKQRRARGLITARCGFDPQMPERRFQTLWEPQGKQNRFPFHCHFASALSSALETENMF